MSMRVTGASRILVDSRTEYAGELHIRDGAVAGSSEASPGEASGEQGTHVLDATGCVITPGLVNAHHHLLQTAFRTLPGSRGVPMAEWLKLMAGAYASAGIEPGLSGRAAAAGLAESLLSGVTTVADHQLNWPAEADTEQTVEIAASVAEAAAQVGARLVFVRGSARDDPQQAAESAEAIARTLVPGAENGVSGGGELQIALGPAGVHSDAEATFRLMGEVASDLGLRRRTQANEQVDVAVAQEKYGRRPLALLEEWGWLAPDVTVAHLCEVTAEEIRLLAEYGVSATHAPGCDVPMGWGVAPVAALQEAGIAVGLGTSGGGSNDAGHLLADARLAMQVSALQGPQLPARTVLGMASEDGARGLGRPELGHLRPGAAADFCVWDISGVADAGVHDPVAGLLWASPGRRPRDVVVGGEFVVRDYRLVRAEEQELVSALTERMAAGSETS